MVYNFRPFREGKTIIISDSSQFVIKKDMLIIPEKMPAAKIQEFIKANE